MMRASKLQIRTHSCSDRTGRTSKAAYGRRQMTNDENLGLHCDDHHGDRSRLVEVTFVHHFVQMARGSVDAGQTEARIAGRAQKMAAALLGHAPEAVGQKVGQKVGRGEGMRVKSGTWGHKALALARAPPES